MTRAIVIASLLAVVAAGCDTPTDSEDAGADAAPVQAEDAGTLPLVDGGDPGPPTDGGAPTPDGGAPALEVRFTAPSPGVTHVRGTVDLQLVALGDVPDRVELWKNGSILVVLTPPYSYAWNTDAESEATHVLEARAIVGGAVLGRAERTFIVDRTPPTILERLPGSGATSVSLADAIAIRFSEPIAASSLAGSTTIAAGGSPLAHTQEQVAPDRLELRPTEAPSALPAMATVTIGGVITDLAGNPLGADDAWPFTYPAWVERASLGQPIFDATVAADGTVWAVYEVSTGTTTVELRAARWTGAVWSEIPTPVHVARSVSDARVRTRASGRAVIVWSGSSDGTTSELRVAEQNGTSWVGYSQPARSDESARPFDLEIEADGAVVLARRIGDEYLVHRYRGAWSQVGATLPAVTASYRHVDLLPSAAGLLFTYISEYDCKAVREESAGWTAPVDIHASSDTTSQCTAARFVESGTGGVYALVDRRTWLDRYSTSPSTSLYRQSDTGFFSLVSAGFGFPSPRYWLSVTPSSTGWYALGSFGGTLIPRVVDGTVATLDGDLGGAKHVLLRAGEPIVITGAGGVLERNVLP